MSGDCLVDNFGLSISKHNRQLSFYETIRVMSFALDRSKKLDDVLSSHDLERVFGDNKLLPAVKFVSLGGCFIRQLVAKLLHPLSEWLALELGSLEL